jgi:hypothetical protein
MAEQGLVNPRAANTNVTTYVSGVDANGIEIPYGRFELAYRANAAVSVGQAVSFVAPTATVPLSVTPMATATSQTLFAGIALESAPAGGTVRVCHRGHCLILANAQTPAAGNFVRVPGTTTGEPTISSTAIDATTVVGTVIVVVFGTKDATSLLVGGYVNQI